MLKVGLTGGMATGKTFVSNILKDLGARVIDADKLSTQAILPGKPPYKEILRGFGKEVLDGKGYIDRKVLGSIVFADRSRLKELESIIHPYVISEQERWFMELEQSSSPCVAVVDAPLLIEAGAHLAMDRVIVVMTDENTQVERALERGGVGKEEVLRRISAQMPIAEKAGYGDYIIDNNGSRALTERRVKDIWQILEREEFRVT